MDVLNTIIKTISAPFQAFLPKQTPPYVPPSVRENFQVQQQPQPKTSFQRLVELNPIYASMNLTPSQIAAHLPVEEKLAQERQQTEIRNREWSNIKDTKKRQMELYSNRMQATVNEESNRQARYENEIAAIEQKYQIYQVPVQFS